MHNISEIMRWKPAANRNDWIAENNEEMQNSTSKEHGELYALRDARRKDTWTPPTKSWWTLEEWIKSWRITVKIFGNKRMTRLNWGMERIRWASQWFRCGFRRNGRVNFKSGKEKMKTLGTRIYSSRTNSEGRDYLHGRNKNKIYCMLILHQIKFMTSNGFLPTTYASWKGLRSDMSQTWEGLHEPPVGLKRMKGLIWRQRKKNLSEPP